MPRLSLSKLPFWVYYFSLYLRKILKQEGINFDKLKLLKFLEFDDNYTIVYGYYQCEEIKFSGIIFNFLSFVQEGIIEQNQDKKIIIVKFWK